MLNNYSYRLSPHFTYGEMIRSDSALRSGINNEADDLQLMNLKNLCINVLEKIRVGLDSPVIINSGLRVPELNILIGGSKYSQHVYGEAADFNVVGFTVTEVFEWIVIRSNIIWDQVIWEFGDGGWIHISYTIRYDNRQLITTAKRKNGKTLYENWTIDDVKQGNIYS